MAEIIHRSDDLAALDRKSPIITLYSGGLDSTFLLLQLMQLEFENVTALVVDLGNDLDQDRVRALGRQLGARVEITDRRAEFTEEYVLPAIRAQAIYLGLHPISASLSRPLIAKTAVALARQRGAQAILHTANRSQNTLRRINGALRLLDYDGGYGSPSEFSASHRQDKQRALAQAGVADLGGRRFSSDSNLWCREFESGALDDPEEFYVPTDLYKWSVPEPGAPSCEVSLGFSAGRPVMVNGSQTGATELIGQLNLLGGRFGLGRYSGLEHLAMGEKVLEVREMPAAALLLSAYRHLEAATMDAETVREKLHVEQIWVREAVEGRWFGALRLAADAFVASVAQAVTGTIRMKLSHGDAQITSIRAARGLYIRNREGWEALTAGT